MTIDKGGTGKGEKHSNTMGRQMNMVQRFHQLAIRHGRRTPDVPLWVAYRQILADRRKKALR